MTKTIVIGQVPRPSGKPIEFEQVLLETLEIADSMESPSEYKYIELICKRYDKELDAMFAYDDPNDRSSGVLFLGHWNGGYVK